jgi:hypothetical protein
MSDAKDSHLALSVTVTDRGFKLAKLAHFEGLTAEQAGRAFGAIVRSAKDAARQMRDAIVARDPDAGAAFEAGFVAASDAAQGKASESVQVTREPAAEPLPTIEDLHAMKIDITGGEDAADYVHRIRGD